jgi:hypothetical protein
LKAVKAYNGAAIDNRVMRVNLAEGQKRPEQPQKVHNLSQQRRSQPLLTNSKQPAKPLPSKSAKQKQQDLQKVKGLPPTSLMEQVQAYYTKKEASDLKESKALRNPGSPVENFARLAKDKLTPQEFRYAMIGIGDRRMQTDEDIQQMVMEADDSAKDVKPITYIDTAYNLCQFATDPLEE